MWHACSNGDLLNSGNNESGITGCGSNGSGIMCGMSGINWVCGNGVWY